MATTVPWAAAAARRSLQEGAAYAQQPQGQGAAVSSCASATTGRSVQTLVVIMAAIVLAAALAGVLTRACSGRHVAPGGDDSDVEGCAERRCRRCLDTGLPEQQQEAASKKSEAK